MKSQALTTSVAKGAPSGFAISLAVHAAIALLASVFVVATIIKPTPEGFIVLDIPKRPVMPIKPIKFRISKEARPEPSAHLVAQIRTDSTPDFRLQNLDGNGPSLLDGVDLGGSDWGVLPDLPITPICDPMIGDTGNSLQVAFFNLNRRRDGTKINIGYQEYFAILRDFVRSGWDTSKLSKYYRSPNRLFATTIMIPITPSSLGPVAFGENVNEGFCWVVYYRGKLVHKERITFRFWGAADDVLTVRVDGKVVLAANYSWEGADAHTIAQNWTSHAPNNRVFRLGNDKMAGGDWITLEPGVPLDFEAIAGEGPGGEFHAQLLVEVKGEEYPLNDRGAPIFPIFAMEEPSWALQDSILENMFAGEANVTNVTTIFRDF